MLYEDLYCARGNCENEIKAVQGDLHSARTSATTFLANSMRLLLAGAAYVLHQALRTHPLRHTALANAQPTTLIVTLFKVATLVKPYKTASSSTGPVLAPSRHSSIGARRCCITFLSLCPTHPDTLTAHRSRRELLPRSRSLLTRRLCPPSRSGILAAAPLIGHRALIFHRRPRPCPQRNGSEGDSLSPECLQDL